MYKTIALCGVLTLSACRGSAAHIGHTDSATPAGGWDGSEENAARNAARRSWYLWAETVGIRWCNIPQITFLECAAFRWRVDQVPTLHELFVQRRAFHVGVFLGNTFGPGPNGRAGVTIDVHGSPEAIRRAILHAACEWALDPSLCEEITGLPD